MGTMRALAMLSALLACFAAFDSASLARDAGADLRPRLLVLTDIGGDPDDQQSLIRLLLYSNELEIEGLIASASGTPGELREKTTRPDLIREIVRAYGAVHERLSRHAEGFPTAAMLIDRIRAGNPNRGREAVGAGHDTEASRFIISLVDEDDPRPLDIAIWGGQTDLAQALWRVREDRGKEGLERFVAKIRVHDIADQDGIAEWMRGEFPGIFYVLDQSAPGEDKREAAFRGMYLGGDESLTSREWIDTHVRKGHGPLGALYPTRTWTAPNPHSCMKEGDTPSWLYFLPHGLNDPDHPDWGGFGGRFRKVEGTLYRDAADTIGDATHARATVFRFRPQIQADFAARLDWCVAESFDGANHAPVAVLDDDRSRRVRAMSKSGGERVTLSAEGSRDPDGDSLSYSWWIYREPGTYRGDVELVSREGIETSFLAPRVDEPMTIHVVLEVRDDGTPRLTSFRRAVVTVTP